MRTFIYGAYIDEPIAMDTASGARYYFVSDGTRSVSLLLGETEPGVWAVVERYAYEDFGEAIVLDAAGLELSASAFGNPYFFQGRRYDAELGLYYYRNRYYDPIHGRFTSRDPLGFWGDPANMGNPYTFLANNPWSFLDPWGLCGMTREQLARKLQELTEGKDGGSLAAFLDDLWDNKEAQTEIIGVFNPVGDLARAGIALDEGDYWGVAENLAGTVPILGDGAKFLSKGARKVLGVGFEYSDEVMMGVKSTPTSTSATRGWKLGDPINNQTRAGNAPSWSAVRARAWKNEALNNPGRYTPAQLERMRTGGAPLIRNPETGYWEPMEWHHNPARRDGGMYDLEGPYTHQQHSDRDPFRY
jgi:RHS repeat-associated protein